MIATRDVIDLASPRPRRVHHLKRGTDYDVLGLGHLQSSAGPLILAEGETLTVYIASDGKICLRHPSEFEDGRFIDIE